MKNFFKNYGIYLISSLFFAVIALIFAARYVRGEDSAYLWDCRWYWFQYADYGEMFRRNWQDWIGSIWSLVQTSEYNTFYTVLLLPFYLLLGGERTAYISALVTAFLVPAGLISAAVTVSLFAGRGFNLNRAAKLWFIALAVIFFPFWVPVLRGFPDIAGLIPLAIAAGLICSYDFSRKIAPGRLVLLGVLLYCPFLIRKWYAYAIIGVLAAAVAASLWQAIRIDKKPVRQSIKAIFFNYLLTGLFILVPVFLIQGKLALHALHTNYAQLFIAYRSSLSKELGFFFGYFGPVLIVFSLLGWFCSLRNPRERPLGVFLFLAIALNFYLEMRVESIPPHHYLPIALWLYMLSGLFFVKLWSFLTGRFARAAFMVLVLAVQTVVFWGVFYPLPKPLDRAASWLLPREKTYQIKVEHYAEYSRLAKDLFSLLQGEDTATVLGSNGTMSQELFIALFGPQVENKLLDCSHLDRRDFFPVNPLNCKYVVVADPVQLHAAADAQQVITIPAREILDGTGLGRSYRRLPYKYDLGGGIKAYIYQKIRPFTDEQVEAFLSRFFRSYPEWRELYAHSLLRFYLSAAISPGKSGGLTSITQPDTLLLQTGEHTPTAIAFDFKSAYKFKQMQIFLFEDEAANPGQKAAEISVKLDGMPVFSGPILPGAAPITINNPFFSVNRLSIRAGNCGKHTRDRIVFAFFR